MTTIVDGPLAIPHRFDAPVEVRPAQKSKLAPKHATEAWKLIDARTSASLNDLKESDRAFWWQTTGITLAVLLENARYAFEDQCRHLHLYRHAIIPELGAKPATNGQVPHWKSFMTDHHCPLEFSWEWNLSSEAPMVRYSFEPIGEFAGTPADPINQYAALRFVNENSAAIDGCDLGWFWHLWDNLVSFEGATNGSPGRRWKLSRIRSLWNAVLSRGRGRKNKPNALGHESRCFFALDLSESSLALKSYFMPGFKAQESGCSTMSVICNAIETLPTQWDGLRPSYKTMMSYLNNDPTGKALIPEIVATDCVAPEKSRMKIYFRTPETSLKSALSVFTLGGAIKDQVSEKGLEHFRQLWNLIWNDGSDQSPDDELALATHRTGGLLYYIEMRPGKATPGVKIYLPLRHHDKGDSESAAALQKFLRTTSRKDFTDDYISSLETLISSSPVKDSNRIQTYLTCMVMGDELRVTSYLSPVVHGTTAESR